MLLKILSKAKNYFLQLGGYQVIAYHSIRAECQHSLVYESTKHKCDQICEKGSYTHIQFFDFKDV